MISSEADYVARALLPRNLGPNLQQKHHTPEAQRKTKKNAPHRAFSRCADPSRNKNRYRTDNIQGFQTIPDF
jgi:hypothetical protein